MFHRAYVEGFNIIGIDQCKRIGGTGYTTVIDRYAVNS